MLEEKATLKLIDVTPFTNVTPEMAAEIGKCAEQIFPAVEELVHDIEIINGDNTQCLTK